MFKFVEMMDYIYHVNQPSIPHYTIRDCDHGTLVVSVRFLATREEFDKWYPLLSERSLSDIDYKIDPTKDFPGYEYHAWFKKDDKCDSRSFENMLALHQMSKLTYKLFMEDRIELCHLFANMVGCDEDIFTKYSEKLKKQIIGPIYRDNLGLHEMKGVYYNNADHIDEMIKKYNEVMTKEKDGI